MNSPTTQTWLNSPKKLLYIYNMLLKDRERTRCEWKEKRKGSCDVFKQKADVDPEHFSAASPYHFFLS